MGLQRVFPVLGWLGYATPLKRPLRRFLIAFRVERGSRVVGAAGAARSEARTRAAPERAAGPALDALGTTPRLRQGSRTKGRRPHALHPCRQRATRSPSQREGAWGMGERRPVSGPVRSAGRWPAFPEKLLLRSLGANCCLSRLRRWGCVRGLSALREWLAACGHIFSGRGSRPKGGGTPQGCPGL
jgi:hypothetical protein